jgi:uncharacterized membrane protein YkoI
MNFKSTLATAALVVIGSVAAQAQDTSQTRIRIQKDAAVGTASGVVATPAAEPMDTLDMLWYLPTGRTCSSVDVSAARSVQLKTDLYQSGTMISPDSAKVIALCAVPGQIGSGEMNVANGRTEYAIDIIPNHKKTHTKVIVDAQTGAVLSSKQFGGLRGLTGWVRESAEHKENVNKAPNDTTMNSKTLLRDSTMMRDTTMRNMMRDTTARRDTTIKRDTTVKRDTIPQ